MAAPDDRQQPGLPTRVETERNEPERSEELFPRGSPPVASRSGLRCDSAGDRVGQRSRATLGHAGGTCCWSARHSDQPERERREEKPDQQLCADGLRQVDPRLELRLRPLERSIAPAESLDRQRRRNARPDRPQGWLRAAGAAGECRSDQRDPEERRPGQGVEKTRQENRQAGRDAELRQPDLAPGEADRPAQEEG